MTQHHTVADRETEAQILARLEASPTLLDVRGLSVDYVTEAGNIRACEAVDIVLKRGEILGIAGESASGKSTLLNALGRLQRMPAATADGEIWFHPTDGSDPVDLAQLDEEELAPYRWRSISIVMQSAMASLNPVVRLGEQFTDVIQTHDQSIDKQAATRQAAELLEMVGISADRLTAFPFQLSGGMQQRALIALALACDPDLVLMDEPTTAVDVVMQRQILDQLLAAQKRLGFAIVFVTHDLSLLLEISDRIGIMYGGRLVELGTAKRLHGDAKHPYTRALRRAFPPLSEPVRELHGIPGSPPDLLDLPRGCAFAPRCELAMPICHERRPELRTISGGRSACFLTNGELSEAELGEHAGSLDRVDTGVGDRPEVPASALETDPAATVEDRDETADGPALPLSAVGPLSGTVPPSMSMSNPNAVGALAESTTVVPDGAPTETGTDLAPQGPSDAPAVAPEPLDSVERAGGATGGDRVPVLEARDVELHFEGTDVKGRKVTIRAVDGVSLKLYAGQISALVGESGSGKTTIARLFSLIYKPTGGQLLHNGKPISVRGRKQRRAYYRSVQLIYQDPFASLNGLKKIRSIISRVVKIHFPTLGRRALQERTADLLAKVNMTPATRYLDRYPTDMSGGQRQRIAIARGLAVDPSVLLADEPTSMLDASIRLDVLNLLKRLRRTEDVAVLYITHDIASARYLSDRITVMYGGKIVETGPTEQIIQHAVHPYTQLLLSAAPDPARYKGSDAPARESIADARPVDNSREVLGCRFADRCPLAMARCTQERLPTFSDERTDRTVQCWLAEDDPDFVRTS